jgi:hypothetical protein
MSTAKTPPLLPGASRTQTNAILGAMRAVAETGGATTKDDRIALASADQYIFGHDAPFALDAIKPVAPAALASALAGSDLGHDALKFLTVMAFVDGSLDTANIANVLRYASGLGIAERYLDEIKDAAQGRLQETLADMTRCNMDSITGRPWNGGDINNWLLPYEGAAADPKLAERFEALAGLAPDTFGHRFWAQFKDNGYAFPGDPKALNAAFSVPHDSVHVLTGYDTKPRGELLASTFTAAMHPKYPMAGHVLPVIFSWHLKIQINEVAGDASGALDPQEFWHAWAAGAAATVDTFAPDWDFWSYVEVPLGASGSVGRFRRRGSTRTNKRRLSSAGRRCRSRPIMLPDGAFRSQAAAPSSAYPKRSIFCDLPLPRQEGAAIMSRPDRRDCK